MSLPDTHAARTTILAALRADAPATALPRPDLQPYLQGSYGRGALGPHIHAADLVQPFVAAARAWRAEVLQTTAGQWMAAVREALLRHGCARVAVGAASPLEPGLSEALQGLEVTRFERPLAHWKAELFDAVDAAVTSAAGGIADTGSLLLLPGPGEPRSLSLVPPVHVAVLRASALHASLPAALRALVAPQPTNPPTNLLLVTGPSKTADIQQTLAYGAHGPRELVIVLVDDVSGTAEETQP
ncbi:MAG TPA: lactate utilization protein C [Burkholderiaceae bacterium]|nr:lactate utilization protein C [Burkholderiaceae bacterium]